MTRGRKPTPNALKLVNGSKRAGKGGDADANKLPPGQLHAPPDHLTDNQCNIWRDVIANAPSGLLRNLDTSLLCVWVVACDAHRTAASQVAKYGMVVRSPRQNVPMQSPYLSIMNRQAEIMLRTASELGFSPTSRARANNGTPEEKTQNRFANNAAAKKR